MLYQPNEDGETALDIATRLEKHKIIVPPCFFLGVNGILCGLSNENITYVVSINTKD